jgi:hypothetical protein
LTSWFGPESSVSAWNISKLYSGPWRLCNPEPTTKRTDNSRPWKKHHFFKYNRKKQGYTVYSVRSIKLLYGSVTFLLRMTCQSNINLYVFNVYRKTISKFKPNLWSCQKIEKNFLNVFNIEYCRWWNLISAQNDRQQIHTFSVKNIKSFMLTRYLTPHFFQ